jgi:membrane protease subunit HflK
MSEHDHHHHDHDHSHEPKAPVAMAPDDSGSRALSDALSSSFFIVKILMGILIVGFFMSGMFTVGPQERAVILRFGKPVGEGERALLGPGFHWAFPAPIDEKVFIPFTQVQVANSTVGWYHTTPEQEAARNEPPPRGTLNPALDSYVLTADANIIHVRAALRYRITDPLQFIFALRDAPGFVTNALNNALFFAAAQFTVDDALTRNVTAFNERVAARVAQLAEQQKLGITVEQVSLTSVIPPRQLADKFRAVLEASVRRDKAMNEAKSYANEAGSRAKGESATRVEIARSDRARLVEAVAAEAKRFSDVLPQYRENPELFVRLRQAEIVQRVLTNAQERIFLPSRADGKSRELRLQLSREPQKAKAAPEAPKDDHH